MNSEQKETLHQALVRDSIVRTCLNCEMFENEKCLLAPTFKLPAKVIVFGCPKWTMSIPF